MHKPDEPDFSAELKPEEAALNLEVDFYGRGKYPPNAMHSEGHQDSMGICLWLALSGADGRGADAALHRHRKRP